MEASISQHLAPLLDLLPRNRALEVIILLAASLVGALVVEKVVVGLLRRWAGHTKTDLDDRLVAALHQPLRASVVLAGLWVITLRLDLPETPHRLTVRVLATVAILVWMVFAIRLTSILLELLSRLQERYALIQPRTVPLFDNLARIVLFGGAVYFLFVAWGVDVTAWMASAGIIGIAVGFAAKDTLANLFSGVFILADAPYKIGDFIVLDSGERGQVTQIGLRSTRLLTRDDVEITIPNAVIANAKIMNESGGPWEKERIRIPVGVAYGSDVDQVRQVLLEVAEAQPEVTDHPAPRVRFRAFGASSLDFELLCWVGEPVLRGRVTDALLTTIYKRFGSEGITIPFPQQEVWIKEWPGGKTG